MPIAVMAYKVAQVNDYMRSKHVPAGPLALSTPVKSFQKMFFDAAACHALLVEPFDPPAQEKRCAGAL